MNSMVIKRQIATLIAVLILMVGAFFMLAWRPQTQKLADLESQWQEQSRRIETARTTISMLDEKRRSAAKTEAELVSIKSKMPTEAELPVLIVEMQNIANDAGVNLLSIRPGGLTSQDEFSEMQVGVSAEGSYVAIIDYLRRIEKANRALKVNSVDVKVKEYPDLSLSLSVSAFTMGGSGDSSNKPPAQSAAAK